MSRDVLADAGLGSEEAHRRALAEHLRVQEFVEFAPDGYLVTDPYGAIRAANLAAAALLNYRKEFLVGKPLAFFVAAEEQKAFYTQLLRLGQAGADLRDWVVRLRRGGGGTIDVTLTAAPMPAGHALPAGIRWMLRDVSPGRRTEAVLRENATFTEMLLQTAPTAIAVVDPEGSILRANPYLSALAGYAPDEVARQDWSELLVTAEDRPEARALLQTVAAGAPASGLFGLTARDGSRRSVAWTGVRLSSPPDRTTLLLTGQDMTALEEAQRKALQAERLAAIGQMVAGLAHESRNALQRSQACLEMLALAVRDRPDAQDLLRRLQSAQDDLHRLYEGVREYAAPMNLRPTRCDLARVWREAWEDLAPNLHGRRATLAEEDCGVDLTCVADPFRLKQVFRNLLDNSMAAGAQRIVIHCAAAELAGRKALQVAVRDDGPGFRPEQRARLFEPFFTTRTRGTGLGLAICKRIVEAHGGRIEASDRTGPGAEVILTLPRKSGGGGVSGGDCGGPATQTSEVSKTSEV